MSRDRVSGSYRSQRTPPVAFPSAGSRGLPVRLGKELPGWARSASIVEMCPAHSINNQIVFS